MTEQEAQDIVAIKHKNFSERIQQLIKQNFTELGFNQDYLDIKYLDLPFSFKSKSRFLKERQYFFSYTSVLVDITSGAYCLKERILLYASSDWIDVKINSERLNKIIDDFFNQFILNRVHSYADEQKEILLKRGLL